jgi:hypothetical protein
MEDLRREIRDSFVDLRHKKALDLLYKKAWQKGKFYFTDSFG